MKLKTPSDVPAPLRLFSQFSSWLFSVLLALGMSLNVDANAAKPSLPYFEADYQAQILGFPIQAKRIYRPVSESISELYFSADSALASLEERSQFAWQDQHIKPIRFSHERSLFGQSRRQILSFDWDKQQITSTSKGETQTLQNPSDALDRLSFQLQLQHDVLQNTLTGQRYPIADKNKIKSYAFDIVGEETIDTPLGKLNTVKVKVLRDNKKRVTYIWLAKDWDYLLARLEQYEGSDKQFSIEVTKAVIGGKKVSAL